MCGLKNLLKLCQCHKRGDVDDLVPDSRHYSFGLLRLKGEEVPPKPLTSFKFEPFSSQARPENDFLGDQRPQLVSLNSAQKNIDKWAGMSKVIEEAHSILHSEGLISNSKDVDKISGIMTYSKAQVEDCKGDQYDRHMMMLYCNMLIDYHRAREIREVLARNMHDATTFNKATDGLGLAFSDDRALILNLEDLQDKDFSNPDEPFDQQKCVLTYSLINGGLQSGMHAMRKYLRTLDLTWPNENIMVVVQTLIASKY